MDTAVSIRFTPGQNEEWGYADHWIEVGRSLDYTGQGAAPAHQTWNRFNMGLLNAIEAKSPVETFEVLEGSPRSFRYWGLSNAMGTSTSWSRKGVISFGSYSRRLTHRWLRRLPDGWYRSTTSRSRNAE